MRKAGHIEKPIYHGKLSFTMVKKAQVWPQPLNVELSFKKAKTELWSVLRYVLSKHPCQFTELTVRGSFSSDFTLANGNLMINYNAKPRVAKTERGRETIANK